MKIQTKIEEIYLKLPMLNIYDEIELSSTIPKNSINNIIKRFRNKGVELEVEESDDKYILKKNGNINFDTYFINV